jgi:catechol 2,3-dioxygenase-like lactoylglutathione lyase family enzyme
VEIYGLDGPYAIGGSNLIVSDKSKAEAFYKKILNAKSGQIYRSANVYDEVLMDFVEGGTWLALFQPLVEKPLTKSRFPSTAFYTTDFDNVLKRLDEEGYGYWKVDTQSSGLKIVIAHDPAGNAIEIIAR